MNYKCPKCGGTFSTPQPVQRVQCPYCHEVVDLGIQVAQPVSQSGYQQAGYNYQQPQQQVGVFDCGPSGKSRGIAALLAIILGGVGAQYFYCGKTAAGVICLIISFMVYTGTFVTLGILSPLLGLWYIITVIQGIVMFSMKQEEFERKYIYTSSSFPVF